MGPEITVRKASTEQNHQEQMSVIKALSCGGLFVTAVSNILTIGRKSPDRKEIAALLKAINDDNMN